MFDTLLTALGCLEGSNDDDDNDVVVVTTTLEEVVDDASTFVTGWLVFFIKACEPFSILNFWSSTYIVG
eukprot:m.13146 g.13146  ORF g.13146 m.13146 type:complete len:69 (-) comp4114_c0_seq1:222-428(-)